MLSNQKNTLQQQNKQINDLKRRLDEANKSITDLSLASPTTENMTLTGAGVGQVLAWNGSKWAPSTVSTTSTVNVTGLTQAQALIRSLGA